MRPLGNAPAETRARYGAPAAVPHAGPVLLFDGLCNLCDSAVLFVIDRDPAGVVRFASLQSEFAANLLGPFGVAAPPPGSAPDSMLLVEDGQLHSRSTAALRLARHLSAGWPLLRLLLIVPRPIRDAAYQLIARNRYRWFGRRETCRLPSAKLRGRFLD